MSDSTPAGSVVVGIDGSTPSDLALEWAAKQASLAQLPLVIVNALATPAVGSTPYVHRELVDQLRAGAKVLLNEAGQHVRSHLGVTDVHLILEPGDPRNALLRASTSAGMLVVGDRGLGPVRELLLGSVSHAMVKHAESPVVVIRPGDQRSRPAGIMVGVAGDGHDDAVLDFAFRLAHTRELPLTLVHCFWDAVGALDGVREVSADEPGYEAERTILDEAAERPSSRFPGVPVHRLLSRGFADMQLIAASQSAELLVLGHRRKRFLREVLYGSIAPRVTEHAQCSVAIVPLGAEGDQVETTGLLRGRGVGL